MSRVRTVSELAASGEATPQDVRNRQLRDEAYKRDYKRQGHVIELVRDAVGRTNPQVAQQELAEVHRQAEGAFVRAVVNMGAEDLLDSDILSVSVGRLREAARRHADLVVQVHADDQRVAKLKDELRGEIERGVQEMTQEVVRQVSPAMATAMQRAHGLNLAVHKAG